MQAFLLHGFLVVAPVEQPFRAGDGRTRYETQPCCSESHGRELRGAVSGTAPDCGTDRRWSGWLRRAANR